MSGSISPAHLKKKKVLTRGYTLLLEFAIYFNHHLHKLVNLTDDMNLNLIDKFNQSLFLWTVTQEVMVRLAVDSCSILN